jgi:hypothetical protein
MTAVRDMPDVTRKKMTIRSRHRFFLQIHFQTEKTASKLLNDAFYSMFSCEINSLRWSDPKLVLVLMSTYAAIMGASM